MSRYESGCRCDGCRMWAKGFNRALARENEHENAQRFEPYGRDGDAFEPEPEAAKQPSTNASLIRRLWQR